MILNIATLAGGEVVDRQKVKKSPGGRGRRVIIIKAKIAICQQKSFARPASQAFRSSPRMYLPMGFQISQPITRHITMSTRMKLPL